MRTTEIIARRTPLTGLRCSGEAHGVVARRGVGEKGRPRQLPQVRRRAPRYVTAASLTARPRSPGYMLTKLTKTILAHDTELKVRPCAWAWGARADG